MEGIIDNRGYRGKKEEGEEGNDKALAGTSPREDRPRIVRSDTDRNRKITIHWFYVALCIGDIDLSRRFSSPFAVSKLDSEAAMFLA